MLEAVGTLPDDAGIEDAMERLYFLAKIEKGIREADSGDTIPHEDVVARVLPPQRFDLLFHG